MVVLDCMDGSGWQDFIVTRLEKALDGIKSAKFIVPCNFEGEMLAAATAGLSPQSSPLMASIEVIGAGLLRFAALCFQWNWFCTIEKYYAKNKKSE